MKNLVPVFRIYNHQYKATGELFPTGDDTKLQCWFCEEILKEDKNAMIRFGSESLPRLAIIVWANARETGKSFDDSYMICNKCMSVSGDHSIPIKL